MQSLPGVDYESMLSELGKYGASFILATQSLAKLDDLSPTMRDTILANVGCLAVFQVAGNDARQLVWELGKDRVSEDDIVSLDVHHCYVRATVGTERMPAFSMMVRKPEDGDPGVADRIRQAASAYTLTAQDLSFAGSDGQQRVSEYRRLLAERERGEQRRERRREAAMRPAGCEAEILRALAEMPFIDRMDLAAVSGWSRGAVYEAVGRLDRGGYCDAVTHATGLLPAAERFHLTAAGLERLAAEEQLSVDELVRLRPVSDHWRRILMERLDAVASVYRLAAVLSQLAYPIRFRWYRAAPLDAALALPDGRTVGIVRRGHTSDRSPFANRMWKLRGGMLPGAVLVLMPDPVRLPARPPDAGRLPRTGVPRRRERGGPGDARRSRMEPPGRQQRRRPAPRPGPAGSRRRASRGAGAAAGLGPRRPRRSPGRAGESPTACCPPPSGPPRSGPSTWCPTGPGFASRTWPECWASPTSGPPRW